MEKPADEHVETLTNDTERAQSDLKLPAYFKQNEWDVDRLTVSAQSALTDEHELSFRRAVQLWPKAVIFSIGISTTLIMEGYDTGLVNSFFGLQQFRQRYGERLPSGDYQFNPAWQSAISAIPNVGGIIGLLFAGQVVDRFGYRWTMFIGLTWLSACIFITFFAQSVQMLFVGNLLCGIPWGMFQTVASSYATDVAPLALRPLLTSYISLCWAIGQFLSTGVLRGVLSRSDQWAYRIPFAIQWVWPIPIAIVTAFAPESPWWLVRRGQLERARHALRRLSSKHVTEAQLDNNVAMMYVTNEHEIEIERGTTYLELFKGVNLRRTETAVGAWVCQVSCGNWFAGNMTYFMEQAGADAYAAFAFGLGMNAASCVGTIVSWFVTPRVGRRPMYLHGLMAMLLTLLVVGFIGVPSNSTPSMQWASGSVLIVNQLIYFLTVGPVCFIVVPEVPSVRLRSKTVAVARAAYNIAAIGASFLNPAILNPSAWDLKQRGGFVWGGFCILSLLWTFFRLPETNGRAPIELDNLFERKLRARDFGTADVNIAIVGDAAVARA